MKFDGESPLKAIKMSKKCKPISSFQKKMKVDGVKTFDEKTQLFNRLTIIAERDAGIANIFRETFLIN